LHLTVETNPVRFISIWFSFYRLGLAQLEDLRSRMMQTLKETRKPKVSVDIFYPYVGSLLNQFSFVKMILIYYCFRSTALFLQNWNELWNSLINGNEQPALFLFWVAEEITNNVMLIKIFCVWSWNNYVWMLIKRSKDSCGFLTHNPTTTKKLKTFTVDLF
jgi:hypothetical protein